MSNGEQQALLTFPCEFPFKVMGLSSDTFESDIIVIVRKHVPNLGEGALKSKPSKNGKYIALTITFIAHSREQLDKLYVEVNEHPDVRMTL